MLDLKDPFPHCVMDGFLTDEIARQVAAEFPAYDDPCWYVYDSPIENKKTLSDWSRFGSKTYETIALLSHFNYALSEETQEGIFSDPGLHGAGLHICSSAGVLAPHLDYDIHPKFGLKRKYNLIIYLTPDWREEYGGHLGFWQDDGGKPGKLVKEIAPMFNRAVLFDTSQNSWHGISRPISAPLGMYRKSIAMYYLVEPMGGETRKSAYFMPHDLTDIAVREAVTKRNNKT